MASTQSRHARRECQSDQRPSHPSAAHSKPAMRGAAARTVSTSSAEHWRKLASSCGPSSSPRSASSLARTSAAGEARAASGSAGAANETWTELGAA